MVSAFQQSTIDNQPQQEQSYMYCFNLLILYESDLKKYLHDTLKIHFQSIAET